MSAKHNCKHFDDGVMFTGDEFEPSEPPSCGVKGVRGRSVCDDTVFHCEDCTAFAPKSYHSVSIDDDFDGDADFPF